MFRNSRYHSAPAQPHEISRCVGILWISFILTSLGLLAACSKEDPGTSTKAGPGRSVPVTVAAVTTRSVPVEVRTFGSVETINTIAIRSLVGETLTKVHITKGQ
ncbi:MAG: hypothetical protein WCI73_13900, partial [Phycisphaerae bacterium]